MSNSISPQKSNNHEWMVAYVTHDFHEAHIVAGRLQSEGIGAMVHQQAGANAIGIHIGSLGEIRVLVHPPDYELALAILYPDEPDVLPDSTDSIIFEDDDE